MKLCWVCKPRKKAIYVDSEGDYYCQDCFDRFKQGSFKWKHGIFFYSYPLDGNKFMMLKGEKE